MFYDLDDPEMMYELDRRHRHWLKENGVIRQGVLWRKEELLAWFDRWAHNETAGGNGGASRSNRNKRPWGRGFQPVPLQVGCIVPGWT